ncbi:MAG TPA: right-handed parallel beta-helix repeat-containing protein [Woeseiaceae bacterium]|nr:right-handed parallel beta-helix repeat-containing protein [Woeseiaceae bacterium]
MTKILKAHVRLLLVAILATGFSVVPEAHAARVLYVATNGNDNNSGLTTSAPLATLAKAHEKVNLSAYGDHTIFIRGGTYYGQSVSWSKHSDVHDIEIAAYQNERPVFDGIKNGVMASYFLAIVNGSNKTSNVTIRGLTIKRYLNWAIMIGLWGDWLGGNIIEDNVFEEIGDRFLPAPLQCSSTLRGYAVVAVEESGNNVIRNNVMVNSENCPSAEIYMHAVYLQHGASNNQIYDNFVSITSGDPFKVRNGSSYNEFFDNYVTRSGDRGFLLSCSEPGEASSLGNMVDNNVVTFPHPGASSSLALTWNCNSIPSTFINNGQRFFHPYASSSESFGAMTSGDFKGNGQNELVVALNYASGITVIARTDNGSKPRTNRFLSKVVYVASGQSVHALTSGDYDGDGTDEMLTYRRVGVMRYVDRGNPTLGIGQVIFADNTKDIVAMASGDFDGSGPDEVVTSFVALSNGLNTVQRGDGLSSLSNFGTIYSSSSWRVTAMTGEDFSGNGQDELVSAIHTTTMSQSRLTRGNGTTSISNFGDTYSSTSYLINAVSGGYFQSTSTPTLVTALWRKSDGFVNVYHHGYSINPSSGTNIHASLWDVVAIDSGQYHTSSIEEVIAAFQNSVGSEVHPGDGTTSLYTYGTFHKWEWP